MAPATRPVAGRDGFGALTMASARSRVMSPSFSVTFMALRLFTIVGTFSATLAPRTAKWMLGGCGGGERQVERGIRPTEPTGAGRCVAASLRRGRLRELH